MTALADVVIPTVGRPTLRPLIDALHGFPGRVIVVDDRPGSLPPLDPPLGELGPPNPDPPDPASPSTPPGADPAPPAAAPGPEVVQGPRRGPAAARNVGWRCATAPWVAFLDDDIRLPPGWAGYLAADLADQPGDVGASEGRIRVPLPGDRRPTDWERNVAGLESGRWLTADLAYRRRVLEELGGFDERFPRAFREDADLGLRASGAGWRIVRGGRWVEHPVRPAPWWISIRLQAGNADDVLMGAIHGRDWYERASAPRGRRRRHAAVASTVLIGAVALATGHRRVGATAAGAWAAGTGELAWARIAPGPRTPREVAAMVVTSAVVPLAASAHWLRGWIRLPRLRRAGRRRRQDAPSPSSGPSPSSAPSPSLAGLRPGAVLLDRDGTLVVDVPFNRDPAQVALMPGAREAVDRLRAEGVPTGVITNQSGIGRGLLSWDDVHAVNRRVVELLGPLGPWAVCPHAPDDGCRCRKPAPGLIERAASLLGVSAADIVVIGDIGADVEAAAAAGARCVLVPTERTRPEEVAAAPVVASSLIEAVELALEGARAPRGAA